MAFASPFSAPPSAAESVRETESVPGAAARMRIGLAANRLHHDAPDAALFRLLREVDPVVRDPLGGDAQIAELLLDGACQRVLFLEDPHVARQHEADIQLLERAARTVTDQVACYGDLATARAWVADVRRRRLHSRAR